MKNNDGSRSRYIPPITKEELIARDLALIEKICKNCGWGVLAIHQEEKYQQYLKCPICTFMKFDKKYEPK